MIKCPDWYVEITREIALLESSRAREKKEIDEKYDLLRNSISEKVTKVRAECSHGGVIYRYDPSYYHGSSTDQLFCGECLGRLDHHIYGGRKTVMINSQKELDTLYNLVNPILR